jgi:hypothetical protein
MKKIMFLFVFALGFFAAVETIKLKKALVGRQSMASEHLTEEDRKQLNELLENVL